MTLPNRAPLSVKRRLDVRPMNRRTLLKHLAAIPLLPRLLPDLSSSAQTAIPAKSLHRVRPSDPSWPSAAAWEKLKQQVGGQLIPVEFPLAACRASPGSA